MPEALSSIRNIGPALEGAFIKAGIEDAETLRDIGVDEGYLKLLNNSAAPFHWLLCDRDGASGVSMERVSGHENATFGNALII